ncbi:CvpA family protein [Sagittula sp.]|uniref:CvpA family protein n=1 Tax=Sagittula sp. TaxID=2038081 RepID=UPI0035176220
MEGFTIFDGVVAGVIVISAILAYSRGFVREALSIAGWIIAAIVAFLFAPRAKELMFEIPYLGDFLNGSCELAVIAAFAAVFAVALVVISLFTPLFSSAVQHSSIGGVDAGLGFLFGVARGVLLIVVALIAYDRVVGNEPIAMISDSRSAEIFQVMQTRIEEQIPSDAPGWIVQRYEELVNSCGPASAN